MLIQLAKPDDFAAILELQSRHHLSATPESQLEEGFVTTRLDLETLEKMREQRAIWVAKSDEEIVAYACAVEWEFYADSNFVNTVFEYFPRRYNDQIVTAENSFIYGPACIDERFRGQGILSQLIAAVKARYAENRAFGVCFVDARNARSLAAHTNKLGFKRLAILPFADVIYHMLAFETR